MNRRVSRGAEEQTPAIGSPPPVLSIVTTLYKSAATIEEFYRRSAAAAEKVSDSFEILMVDDGSPDESLDIALRLAREDSRLKVVELSRNFGHHKALMTGLMHAAGEYSFLIDSDLEEAPELLLEFWELMQKDGHDVVYGYQAERTGNFVQQAAGAIAYRAFNALLSHPIPHNHITVRLMKRVYVNALISHREHMTAIGALWVITGFRQFGAAVNKGTRQGTTYSFGRRWYMMVESVTSFSEVPLVAIFYLGMLISAFAGLTALWLVIRWFAGGIGTEGWASLMVSLWLVGGLLIFCLGVIGLYVSRVFIETKQRPYTIIRAIHQSTRDKAS